jgi:hypothetical protein
MKLTPAQKRVMTTLWSGALVRRRGAFGGWTAPASDGRFAASRTIDCLWRAGLIRPASWWGAFEAAPKKGGGE